MDESQNTEISAFVQLDSANQVQGSRVTSNGGLTLVRELNERMVLSELIKEHLTDSRASYARFSLTDLLRQSVYSRLAGYEDVNDGERRS